MMTLCFDKIFASSNTSYLLGDKFVGEVSRLVVAEACI
jgi:hypothetical protein